MNNKWDKILLELSYRVSSGIPDLSNEQHLMKLWDILKEHNWNIDARVELLKNLNEQDKPSVQSILNRSFKNAQSGRMIKVSSALGYKNKPKGQAAYGVAKGMMDDAGYGEEAEKLTKQKGGEEEPTDKKKKEKEEPTTKSKEVADFEDRVEKNKFLSEEQKELAREANKKIEVIYDDNATPEQKKEAVNWLVENMKLSTNAKTKTNNRKAYFNIFGGERKVISGNAGTAKSEDLIKRIEEILGEPLDVVNVKGIKDKISSAAKPDLGKENIVKHPFEDKYLQELHERPPLDKIRDNNTGIFAVKDENGKPKLPSSEHSKEYLRQSFDNPSLDATIKACEEEAAKNNIDPKVATTLKDHKKELDRIYNEMEVPSQEASDAILKAYNKLMVDLNNADSDMVGAIMKQQAEMALYQSEIAKGDEVYLPSSGTFPVGDKIKAGTDTLEQVALISCKYDKQGRIHGCPDNSKTICEIHQDESKRNNQGQYIGEPGHTMLINDDLVIGKDRNETAQKTEKFITDTLDEIDLGDTFSSDDKKKISSIAADYSEEIKKIKKELDDMGEMSKPDYYGLLAQRMKEVDEKYGKLMSEAVSDDQISALIGKNNAKNLRRSKLINPAEMLSAIEIANNIRTNETLESTEHNKQYFDKDGEPVFKTSKGTRNPDDWSITFRSKRTKGRSGGGCQLSFTGDGERPDTIITDDGTIENVETGNEEMTA